MSELARRTTEKIKRLGEKLGLKAARGAGSLALSSSVETNGPISRREALKNRAGEHKRIISRAYKDYVTEAASRGMDESAIRQSLPDAWNSGCLKLFKAIPLGSQVAVMKCLFFVASCRQILQTVWTCKSLCPL